MELVGPAVHLAALLTAVSSSRIADSSRQQAVGSQDPAVRSQDHEVLTEAEISLVHEEVFLELLYSRMGPQPIPANIRSEEEDVQRLRLFLKTFDGTPHLLRRSECYKVLNHTYTSQVTRH